jgi:hypothetical protein
MERP